jgi:UDP-2,3-diacylglucosamine pyrophosphatase LpxH
METLSIRKTYSSRSEIFNLYPLGDVHLGAKGVDRDLLHKTIEFIKNDDKAIVFCMGDMVDAVFPDDRRWDARTVDSRYTVEDLADFGMAQLRDAEEVLEPIKDKIVCFFTGNHEEKIAKKHGLDVTKRLALEFGKPYMGYSGFVRINFARGSSSNTLNVYMHHGRGSGRSLGSAARTLESVMNMFEADVYMMGHIHNKCTIKRPLLRMSKSGDLVHKERIGAFSGSFLKTYVKGTSTYPEVGQYPPSELGTVCIRVKPDVGKMIGVTDILNFG